MEERLLDGDAIDRLVGQWQRERPDLDVSPTHVVQRITRLYLLQSASIATVMAAYGLTFGEYEVLAALRRSGEPFCLNPTALFNALVLSSGAMTNRIDRLEAEGLVERRSNPADRRERLVALTEKGRRTVDEAVVAHLANEERLLSGLTADQRAKLADLLRGLLLSEPFSELDPARDRRGTTSAPAADRPAGGPAVMDRPAGSRPPGSRPPGSRAGVIRRR